MIPSSVDIVKRLVAEPSVSAADPRYDQPNRRVVDHLAELCEALGFRVEVQSLDTANGKANLMATLGDGPGGLVLAGHTDTVPFDEAKWATDPFELVGDDDGRLFGLGSADMKGFFGAALHAAKQFRAGALREPLVLLATADEESTMGGARALLESGRPTARYAVVGEPTNLVPVRMHKGILMEQIAVEGRSGHSSDPSLGASALDGMYIAMGELIAFRADLAQRFYDEAFDVPTPTINLGRIEGGDSPNRICAHCALTFDVRLMPGMDVPSVRKELRERIERALDGRGLTFSLSGLVEPVPPHETPADAELVKTLEAWTGSPSKAVMFCTESPFFASLGMETVVCGAGSIEVAHQPNEHTSRRGLEAATDLYAKLIHRYCVEATPAA